MSIVTDQQTLIAECVASRICHDLVSPIGALRNAAEMLDLIDDDDDDSAMEILKESTEKATALMQFLRVAMGQQSDENIHPTKAKLYCDGALSPRITVMWKITTALPKSETKALFLAILCIEHALQRGGEITVEQNHKKLSVMAKNPNINIDLTLFHQLYGPRSDARLEPATVEFLLLPYLLQAMDWQIDIETDSDSLKISFSPK